MGIVAGHPGDNVECVATRSATGDGQAFFLYAHRDTWDLNAFTAAAVNTPADLSTLTKYDLGNAGIVHIYGATDKAGASITIIPVWFDRNGHAMYVDSPIVLTAGAYRISASGLFVSVGAQDSIWCNSAFSIGFLVQTVTASSTWTISCVPTG